ncbi:MAG TPA: undecaprenyl-phosphate glucose phosphotransferase [Stellaceae bacterium]|nr:undecaprenyl-phosphate glucose phosphotransferase [Stellaceae bacterium]
MQSGRVKNERRALAVVASAESIGAGPSAASRPTRVYCPAVTSGLVCVGDLLAVLISGVIVFKCASASTSAGMSLTFYFDTIVSALAIVCAFGLFNLYDFSAIRHPRSQLRRIFWSGLAAFAVVELAGLPVSAGYRLTFSEWAYAVVTLAVTAIYCQRWVAYQVLQRLAYAGHLSRNVIVVGGGEQGSRLIAAIQQSAQPFTRILGVFDDRSDRIPNRVQGCAVLGPTRALADYARRYRVDDIVIALPWSASARIQQILQALRPIPARIHICPDGSGADVGGRMFVEVGGVPAINLVENPHDGWRRIFKYLEDRCFAAAILLFLAPLMCLIALAIKLDSPGPVFFRQRRLGWNSKIFLVWKFRTMHQNQTDENAAKLTTPGDCRVTRVGRFLRRTSLDELPQFFNVLTGEMSVVGPRPHALQAKAGGRLYHEVVEEYAVRHKIKPGITGWAQVNGWRGDTDTEEKLQKRVECDLYYMEHWSLLFDFYIILQTVKCVLVGTGY